MTTSMTSTQFDLEHRIMQCWQVVNDLDILTAHILDVKKMSEDEIANALIGIKQLYDMKFYGLMSTYEKYLKEQHK
jgi:hypothetical protein